MTLTDDMCQKKKEGRGFASIEDSVGASIQRLENYLQKRGGSLITATRSNTDDTRNNKTEITKKHKKSEEKQLYRRF